MTLSTPVEGGKATSDPLTVKWEKRKRPSTAFAPSLRSGCTMALWSAKNMGILFGGVTDEDTSEETMESVFHNDLYVYVPRLFLKFQCSSSLGRYGYQIAGNGRWVSMALKRPKKKGGQKPKKVAPQPKKYVPDEDSESEMLEGDDYSDQEVSGRFLILTPISPTSIYLRILNLHGNRHPPNLIP